MNAKLLFAIFWIILVIALPISMGDIVVQTIGGNSTSQPSSTSTSGQDGGTTFIVNKYIVSSAQQQQPKIMIQQIVSEATVDQCNAANFSFKITNPTSIQQVYAFSVKNFVGTTYITTNLLLSMGQSKIVAFRLLPDCSLSGDQNPKIVVDTQDGSEEAIVPVLLHITPGTFIDQNSCLYYYNQTVCSSKYYFSFNRDTTYNIDLSKWFYDPDGNKLQFSTSQGKNLAITVKDNVASIKPIKGWYGSEDVIFYADDGNGGTAASHEFYFQVLNTPSKSIFDFILRLFS